jgi:hypothetical protein
MSSSTTFDQGDTPNIGQPEFGMCTAKTITRAANGSMVCHVTEVYTASAQLTDALGHLDMALVAVVAVLVYALKRKRLRNAQ